MRYCMDQGDEIPEHAHDESTLHNIIVLHGTVDLYEGSAHTLLMAGVHHDFDGTKPHKIVCHSAHAAILNLFLNGIPQGYAELPESERQGTINARN